MAKWFDAKLTSKVDANKQQNQHVTISSSNDVLFDIGIKLGKISAGVNSTKNELKRINDKIENHEMRIKKLENKK